MSTPTAGFQIAGSFFDCQHLGCPLQLVETLIIVGVKNDKPGGAVFIKQVGSQGNFPGQMFDQVLRLKRLMDTDVTAVI